MGRGEQQEKFQAILSGLLKDEDNKYCVDCDAKGPRWASWNLGIFLCIRCAGIHRNLGVHISKVKSVNLDTWTPEQVAMMQDMGNSRARAVYEANIPDGFRRPQSDSALEAFIRSKYEQKKYIAREWVPPQPKIPKEWLEDPRAERKRAKNKPNAGAVQLTNTSKAGATTPPGDVAKPALGAKTEVKVPVKTEAPAVGSASNDLLGLEDAAPPPTSGSNELLDLFGGPQMSQAPSHTTTATATAPTGGNDLMNGTTSDAGLFGEEKSAGGEKKASTKDSIMALYGGGGGGGGGQPQVYGVPAEMSIPPASHSVHMNGSDDLMKTHDVPKMIPQQKFAQVTPSAGMGFSQPQPIVPQGFNQSAALYSAPGNQHVASNQSAYSPMIGQQFPLNQSAGFAQGSQQVAYSQSAAMFGGFTNQQPPFGQSYHMTPPTSGQSGQYPAFNQSPPNGPQQKIAPIPSTSQAPSKATQQFLPAKQSPNNPNKPGTMSQTQAFGQQMGPNPGTAWGYYNQPQPSYYGNQGGMYMSQAQQMYPGMMGQQSGVAVSQAGMRQPQQGLMGQNQGMMGQNQGLMGQNQGMMGQNQGMGLMGQQGVMGQTQGMMGNPGMNGPQMGMYNGQMVPGMYNPQQMQQYQFQQMQQQMTSLKLGSSQMGAMPHQATSGTAGWGNPTTGQTLSNNLWQ